MPTISFRSAFAKRSWIIRHQALDTRDRSAKEKSATLARLDHLRSLVESSDVAGLVDRLLDYGTLAKVMAREAAILKHPLFWPWGELYRLTGDALTLLKPEAIPHLQARLKQEGLSPLESELANQALGGLEKLDTTTQFAQSPEEELELIYSALNDPNSFVRWRAVEALHGSSTPRATSEFERLRSDPDPRVRSAAFEGLRASQASPPNISSKGDSELKLRSVNCVATTSLEALHAFLDRKGFRKLALDGREIRDADRFYQAVKTQLPLDPPLSGTTAHWDALADSLWGGIAFLEAPRVAIIWTDCDQMLTGGLPDLLIIASVLEHLSIDAIRIPVQLKSFLVGAGPNFPAFTS